MEMREITWRRLAPGRYVNDETGVQIRHGSSWAVWTPNLAAGKLICKYLYLGTLEAAKIMAEPTVKYWQRKIAEDHANALLDAPAPAAPEDRYFTHGCGADTLLRDLAKAKRVAREQVTYYAGLVAEVEDLERRVHATEQPSTETLAAQLAARVAALAPEQRCSCDWLGIGTPEHGRSAFCRPSKQNVTRTGDLTS